MPADTHDYISGFMLILSHTDTKPVAFSIEMLAGTYDYISSHMLILSHTDTKTMAVAIKMPANTRNDSSGCYAHTITHEY